jgi:iron complex outermembrane receptor protein
MLASFDGGGFELPEFDEFSVPVVLTATRIQQHQSDVPASVTILDADLIKQLGLRNLTDLLRYVPGIMISPDRNNNGDSVYYHGGPTALPKNLQVLLNGRSMYRSGLASVSWYEMPVAIEDIRRIEVVRGPNSATYGANAYQAVINILTKHPADTYGSSASIVTGNNGEENVYLKQGGRLLDSDYRISFVQKRTDHYKNYIDESDDAKECLTKSECPDNREVQFIDLEVSKQLSGQGELDISVTASQSEKAISNLVANQTKGSDNIINEDRYELGLKFTKDLSANHQIQITSSVSRFNQRQPISVEGVPVVYLNDDLRALFTLNPEAADGESVVASSFDDVKEDYENTGDATNFVSYWNGVDVTIDGAVISGLTAQTKNDLGLIRSYEVAQLLSDDSVVTDFIASLTAEEQARAMGVITSDISGDVSGTVNADLEETRFDIEFQDTYVFNPEFTLVSGFSYRYDVVDSQHYFTGEKTNETSRIFTSATWQPSDDVSTNLAVMGEKEDRTDFVFAPRAALNYKLTPSQSMRLVYSESVRSPDLLEQSANWNFTVDNAQTDGTLSGITFYQTAQGPENLEHQSIQSYEVGYYGRLTWMDSELDVRIFHEELDNVLLQSIKLDDLKTFDDNEITFQGIEWQMNMRPWQSSQFRFIGTHIKADWDIPAGGTTIDRLLSVFVEDSGVVTWIQDWGWQARSSVSYLFASKYDQLNPNVDERGLLERIEFSAAKDISMRGYELEINLTAQHDFEKDTFAEDGSVFEKESRVQLGLRCNF